MDSLLDTAAAAAAAAGLLARMPFAAGASEVVPARMAVAAPATYGFAARHVQ
jgi:hypothetical protein